MSAPRSAASGDPDAATLLAERPHLAYDPMAGLMLEGVPLAAIAQALGTPCWVYGGATMRTRYRALAEALTAAGLNAQIHYAIKANDHSAVIDLFAAEGAGADVVSGGEIRRALAAGMPAGRLVFSGVGKTERELRLALEASVAQINVESAEELEMLDSVACALGRRAPVALRVNPDVDAATHTKITTGLGHNKFGIPLAEAAEIYVRATALEGIAPIGLALHIGSQIGSLAPFRTACRRLAALARSLIAAGYPLGRLDAGGGIPISYRDEPPITAAAYAGALKSAFAGLDVELLIEPGRWLAGPAGVLLTAVVLEKNAGGRRFVVVDAAMNDLVRPALYDAWHGIVPVAAEAAGAPSRPADVVGPVCETADTFARDRALPMVFPGALLAVLDAGAYGATMSSTYNSRPLAAAALVENGSWTVIRPRQEEAALWATERLPDWRVSRSGNGQVA